MPSSSTSFPDFFRVVGKLFPPADPGFEPRPPSAVLSIVPSFSNDHFGELASHQPLQVASASLVAAGPTWTVQEPSVHQRRLHQSFAQLWVAMDSYLAMSSASPRVCRPETASGGGKIRSARTCTDYVVAQALRLLLVVYYLGHCSVLPTVVARTERRERKFFRPPLGPASRARAS